MTRPNAKAALIRGASWSVATRWSIKALGFLNTVVMARLLMPAEYGVVAMAMLVVGLIQAFLDLGATTALLRKAQVTRDEIDSVWTLRLLQSIAIGVVLALVSPLAASYFSDDRVQHVLWVFAACVAVAGAANVGLTLAQKEFNFSLEFRHQVVCKAIGVLVTIVAGNLLRDYRALVLGIAAGYVSGLISSYVMHPYRPRWNTRCIPEIWALTKWLMVSSMAGFVLRKGDELVAARIGSPAQFGLYNVGADLGQMPTGEVGPAMLKAFLPVLSTLDASVERVNAVVVKTVAAVNTLTLGIGLGFAAVATNATLLILGPNWIEAAPFVAAFSVLSALSIMFSPLSTLLVFRGHTKIQSQVVWLEFAGFALAATVLVPSLSLTGLIWARALGTVVRVVALLLYTRKYCGFRVRALVLVIVRPLLGALLMFALVQWIDGRVESALLAVVLGVLSAAPFYALWCFLSWVLVKRPEGLESTLWDALAKRLRR